METVWNDLNGAKRLNNATAERTDPVTERSEAIEPWND